MRTNIRRATVVLALTPVISFPTAAAFAGTGVSSVDPTPAPAGDSSAVAAQLDDLLTVGKTAAHAGSTGGTANADALDLLGTRVVGGDQTKVGHSDGNLIGTGDTPLGDAEVAPWSATVTNDNGGFQSSAEAALAHVNIADAAEIWLLHSKSAATWSPDKSSGDSESDGAEVNLGGGALDIKVLHSEAHSGGTGLSSLLVVNGTPVVSSGDAGGQCNIDASPLIQLLCLTASGGTGTDGLTTSGADVVDVNVGDGALPGTVVGTKTSGGGAVTTPTKQRHHHQTNQHGPLPHTNGPKEHPSAGLPFTGSDAGRLGAIAAALAALGAAMAAHGRRRFSLGFGR
ncbi:MAG TPA: hypothetical protein VFT62_10375 [Mycobacteriales bacterium]|nr:hypothetical protein [Mycobacteriales bacterium]